MPLSIMFGTIFGLYMIIYIIFKTRENKRSHKIKIGMLKRLNSAINLIDSSDDERTIRSKYFSYSFMYSTVYEDLSAKDRDELFGWLKMISQYVIHLNRLSSKYYTISHTITVLRRHGLDISYMTRPEDIGKVIAQEFRNAYEGVITDG